MIIVKSCAACAINFEVDAVKIPYHPHTYNSYVRDVGKKPRPRLYSPLETCEPCTLLAEALVKMQEVKDMLTEVKRLIEARRS